MATRFKKMLEPILKEECNKAFKRGFEEGKAAGWDERILAYENEIEFLKSIIRGLTKEENIMNHTQYAGKAMLSQPMAGKTNEEIIATREKAIKALKAKGYKVVNTLFTDEWYSNDSMEGRGVENKPLCFLAKSLENMSLCRAAYFCKGWENARGCKIEHDAAVAYGLDIIYEE